MAEQIEIINGVLRITKTTDPVIQTMSKDDLIGQRAEAQTKVDHLQIDLDAAKAEVIKLDMYLVDIDKTVEQKK